MKHQDREKGQFWKEWATEVAIGAAIGAVTGAFTAGAGGLAARAGTEIAKTGGTQISVWIAKAAIHGGAEIVTSVLGSVVSTYASNAAANSIYGTDEKVTASDVLEGIGEALAGAAAGKILGKAKVLKKLPKVGKATKEAFKTGKVKRIVLKNNSISKFRANGGKTITNILNKPAPVKYTFMRLDV